MRQPSPTRHDAALGTMGTPGTRAAASVMVVTHPDADPRLIDTLAGLIDPRTAVEEVADPALPPTAAYVATERDRLLLAVTASPRLTMRVLQAFTRCDATYLAFLDRNDAVRDAARGWINCAEDAPEEGGEHRAR